MRFIWIEGLSGAVNGGEWNAEGEAMTCKF